MEKFRYSFFAKIIYRYGNIIATLLLSVHLIASLFYIQKNWLYIFPGLINFLVIFLVNKYFIRTYKFFPFNFEVDNEKMICKNFFLSNKKLEIYYKDIDKISGGIFSSYPTRPIYIYDSRQKIKIGFYSHVGNFQKLLTKILQNVPQKLYNEIMDQFKEMKNKNPR